MCRWWLWFRDKSWAGVVVRGTGHATYNTHCCTYWVVHEHFMLHTALTALFCRKLTTPTDINMGGISSSSTSWMVKTLRQRVRSLNRDRQPTILNDTWTSTARCEHDLPKNVTVAEKPRDTLYFFTALHGMQTRSNDENSVCLSLRPSVSPSNAWIVTKRKRNMSRFLYHTKDHLA